MRLDMDATNESATVVRLGTFQKDGRVGYGMPAASDWELRMSKSFATVYESRGQGGVCILDYNE